MSDITLTAGMRSNLISLQNTESLLNQTQGRLATGKKVNSALDNPTNFFAASAHLQRASEFSARKDGMSEAIQAVKAADNGIMGVKKLLESAKGLIESARSATTTNRASLGTQFDNILTQINQLVGDSGYKGTNFLGGTTVQLDVLFNEDGSNKLTLTGFNGKYTALGSYAATIATTKATTVATVRATTVATAIATVRNTVTATGAATAIATVRNTTVATAIATIKATTLATTRSTSGSGVLTAGTTWGGTNYLGYLNASSDSITRAVNKLQAESSKLAANLSVVNARLDFTKTLVSNEQVGADALTLADTNEEGANMLALQTRQQLGVTSLSLASQAAQGVLRLF